MNVDRQYLSDLIVRLGETRKAVVEVGLVADRYTLRDTRTGGRFFAKTALTSPIAVGKVCTVRISAAGRSLGQPPEIIAVAQDAGNGAITGELDDTQPISQEVVTQWPVLPVQLVAGGPYVTVMLFGTNLFGVASYGVAGITDAVPQSAEGRAIRLSPKASGATAKGRYDATVAGLIVPNFFEVV